MRGLAAAVLFLLAGCVTAPDVRIVPEKVSTADPSAGNLRTEIGHWWKPLGDQALHELISTGLADSPSMQIALARLAQAEVDVTVARAARWPWVQGSGTREVLNFSDRTPDTRTDLGAIGLSWDTGLWGKRRLDIQQARQFRDQRWFEREAVALALSTSIAETYYQIAELRMQGAVLASQIEVSEGLERLIEARFRLGQAPANELYQQREQTTVLQQLKLGNDTRLATFEMSLDALLGEVPDDTPRVSVMTFPDTPALEGLTAPEELVRYRADIRAGFARLRQAASTVGIRFAERLPTLQVTASLTSLAEKTMSTQWFGHGLDLALPIFTGGRLRGLEKRARHQLEEERQRYLELWLSALNEVESLAWQFQQQQHIVQTLTTRRAHAERALNAARGRYVLGDQNYISVLTALRAVQEADRALVAERRTLITLWIRASESIGQPMCADALDCATSWQL